MNKNKKIILGSIIGILLVGTYESPVTEGTSQKPFYEENINYIKN